MTYVYKGAGVNLSENPVKIKPKRLQPKRKSAEADGVDGENQPTINYDAIAIEIEKEAKEKAKELLQQAQAKAQANERAIIDKAEQSAKKIFDEEYQKAYDLGIVDGRKQKLQEIEQAIATLSGEVDKIRRGYEAFEAAHKQEVLTLTLALCEKILAEKISADDNILQPIVTKALEDMKTGARCSIIVSHEALPSLEQLKWELTRAQNLDSEIFNIIAKDVPKDFCIIETENEILDVSINNQFENLLNILKHEQ